MPSRYGAIGLSVGPAGASIIMTIPPGPPGVTGMPRVMLRLEGAALFLVTWMAYGWTGTSWWLFAGLFLAPDLSFLGFVAGPRTGAVLYNIFHTTLGPIVLGGLGYLTEQPLALALSLIWACHVGFDRMVGYGLKYDDGFGFTHLGRIGRTATAAP
jgi:uncharacterized protein DUF4260